MATIMLIEDNLIYRELLRELCEMEGHSVIETGRAEDALQMLSNFEGLDVYNQERRIDLFIVDFNMDRMNGFELIRELRGMEKMRSVPVMMISSTNKNMGGLLSAEGVVFLPKPSPNHLVLSTMRRLLNEAPGRPGEASAPTKALPQNPQSPPVDKRPAPRPPAQPIKPPRPAMPLPSPIVRTHVPPRQPLRVPPPSPTTPPRSPARLPLREPIQKPVLEPKASQLPPTSPPAVTPPPPRTPPQRTPASQARSPFAPMDDNIKNDISQSAELTEFLTNLQKAAVDEDRTIDSANSPVAGLLEKILDSAIRQHASDIHIEPQAETLDIRLRVDGVLQPLVRLPHTIIENVVARVKIMCSLNITEKRLPQDGQFVRNTPDGQTTKFRVSTLPSMHGEKVVMRLLPSGKLLVNLDGVGFSEHDLALARKVLRTPNGLILLTGPTGSGKTTTLYSMLDSLNSGKRNIVTVEDPVEYQLPGITQVQVNPAIGYTFERILRSFLRQDPDVMLVGEIRDLETAEIALKAAATGHLVLTTLHTNSAASAVQRLIAMGLPGYLVAAAARLVIAQRLVRVLCPSCKAATTLSDEESCLLEPHEVQALRTVWRPTGCPRCKGIGYLGRRVVMEALPILSGAARMAVTKGASPDEIQTLAMKEGMLPMRHQALQLVADGTISVEEALTVLHV
ncbi:MAG: ATPase, T2SS/T4P/T4SS family [Elusimicrobiota bacterium]